MCCLDNLTATTKSTWAQEMTYSFPACDFNEYEMDFSLIIVQIQHDSLK